MVGFAICLSSAAERIAIGRGQAVPARANYARGSRYCLEGTEPADRCAIMHLSPREKTTVVCAAVARELADFMSAVAKGVRAA